MKIGPRITPFLWFDDQAEAAALFYTSIFPGSEIVKIERYPENAGVENHGNKPGAVMTVAFSLSGTSFTALNGGPHFRFTEAVSFVVECADQDEIDHFWNALSDGGPVESQQCGWLKDRFGLSWQIVPECLPELMEGKSAGPVMEALLSMKKLDISELKKAAGVVAPAPTSVSCEINRNPVGWFEIYVTDLQRSRKFYESVLEVELETLPTLADDIEMLSFPGGPELGGANGAICKMEGCEPGGSGTIIYFSCKDCANEESRVVENGGHIVKAKFSIGPYGDICLATDPDGNMIGFHNPAEDGGCCKT
ncbi:MAG: VOC family protein [Verrucomicrobiales bacterium]|nr:VOC family protein [Verrucomicrobiales bacterium]